MNVSDLHAFRGTPIYLSHEVLDPKPKLEFNSIHLPPGQDFRIISYDEDLYQDDSMEFENGFQFGNITVVDNIPVVPEEKFEKLKNVIKKIYGQIGAIRDNGIWMPKDPETQTILGYCFVKFCM